MQKLNQYLLYVLTAVGAVFTVLTMANPTDGIISGYLMLSYILFAVGIVAAVGGSIWKMITNPTNLKKSGISLGFILIIVILSYVLASDVVLESYGDISPTVSKWSEAGLFILYILSGIALLSILYSSVSKAIK